MIPKFFPFFLLFSFLCLFPAQDFILSAALPSPVSRETGDALCASHACTPPVCSSPDSLLKACNDTSLQVRSGAYAGLFKEIVNGENPRQREKMLLQLLRGCTKGPLCAVNRNRLVQLPPDVFHPEARYILSMLVYKGGPCTDKLILLCAHLEITDLLPDFKQRLQNNTVKSPSLQHAMHLALARMGDRSEMKKLMRFAQNQPVTDDFIYEVLPELLYTRHPDAYELAFDIILSPEILCGSSNPSSDKKIPCAYRLIEMMAPLLEDFPPAAAADGSAGTIEEQDLAETRAWIQEHRKNFRLVPASEIPLTSFFW